MLLTRFHPNDQLESRNDLDRFFGDFFAPTTGAGTPATDIVETENDYRLSLELPGLDKDAFKITVQHNQITVSAEKTRSAEVKESQYHRRERSYGKFERSFRFADDVQTNAVKAAYRNGVLEIVLPKAEEAKPRLIEVKLED